MRVVLQRVRRAAVTVEGVPRPPIGPGYVLLLGIQPLDTEEDGAWLVRKIAELRLFPDAEGRLAHSLSETGGEVLVVSQFTLFASVRKGTRPSFHEAARPEVARPLYERFLVQLAERLGRPPAHGEFGAEMQIELVNDGPVTLIIDSPSRAEPTGNLA